jgi:hypothetical protein
VRVAALEVNGEAEIVTGPRPRSAPETRVYDALSAALIDDFFAFSAPFQSGIFVAGG